MIETAQHSNKFAVASGLGIGEETKGATVQWLVRQLNAHTVLRSGGCQAGHHIVMEDGREQMFSHFGAGTFEGARTHLQHMVINPSDLYEEAMELETHGVPNPLDLITIDSSCLTITPYHGAMSRIREIMRGHNKKGTVGMGVGDALRDANNFELSIRAGEFLSDRENLERKVEAIRRHKVHQAQELMFETDERPPDRALAELDLLFNRRLAQTTVDTFIALGRLVHIVDPIYLDDLLRQPGSIVNEPSHGALLHPFYGFVPHVTQVDPTSQDVLSTLQKHQYKGKILRLGVSRTYMTRHGAGPLVSYSQAMTQNIQETHNDQPQDNEWIGQFRNGFYDTVAMEYALNVSGGARSFDGLAISYMDVLSQRSEWPVCVAYEYDGDISALDPFFLIKDGLITGIRVHPNTGDEQHLEHQRQLTRHLNKCHPVLMTLTAGKDTMGDVFIHFVEQRFGLPVVVTSNGPKASDRSIRSSYESLFT